MTWLRSLLRRWRDRRRDPAWAPTGIRQVYAGYDAVKADAGIERARRRKAGR